MGINESISAFYQRHQVRIRDIGILIIGVILLCKSFGILDKFLSEKYADGVIITIVLFIFRDISANLPRKDDHIYGEQSVIYQELRNEYRDKKNGEVVFYHYSGTTIHEFIVMLYANGYSVRLYIESPAAAEKYGSDHQANRISNMLMLLKDEIGKHKKGGRISIYQTDAPVTVRAAQFDGKHIALGWYVYEWITTPLGKFPHDKVHIWGHDSFGMLINDQHPGFKYANKFLASYEDRLAASEIWSFPVVK